MTHRDGFPWFSARSAWRGDAGHLCFRLRISALRVEGLILFECLHQGGRLGQGEPRPERDQKT